MLVDWGCDAGDVYLAKDSGSYLCCEIGPNRHIPLGETVCLVEDTNTVPELAEAPERMVAEAGKNAERVDVELPSMTH